MRSVVELVFKLIIEKLFTKALNNNLSLKALFKSSYFIILSPIIQMTMIIYINDQGVNL
jgi:hypothetical protein